eukprot:COSAG06_NODE_49664_length_323_cov_197.843750_2_plen_63_part_00
MLSIGWEEVAVITPTPLALLAPPYHDDGVEVVPPGGVFVLLQLREDGLRIGEEVQGGCIFGG